MLSEEENGVGVRQHLLAPCMQLWFGVKDCAVESERKRNKNRNSLAHESLAWNFRHLQTRIAIFLGKILKAGMCVTKSGDTEWLCQVHF